MSPYDLQGLPGGFLGLSGAPGAQKGGFRVFGAGGTSPLAPLLALSWANRVILTYMAAKAALLVGRGSPRSLTGGDAAIWERAPKPP